MRSVFFLRKVADRQSDRQSQTAETKKFIISSQLRTLLSNVLSLCEISGILSSAFKNALRYITLKVGISLIGKIIYLTMNFRCVK